MSDVKMCLLNTVEQFVCNCGDFSPILCQNHHLKPLSVCTLIINRILRRLVLSMRSRAANETAGPPLHASGPLSALETLRYDRPWLYVVRYLMMLSEIGPPLRSSG
jgi:hypothetical protein